MSAPGSALAFVLGRYAIGEEIARGGLATVHLGLVLGEAGFARTIAVKRLLPGFARDPEFVASFLDEAKLAARIRHPSVVATLDVLAQDGELFVVMEYVHGESLAGLVRAAADRDEAIPLSVVSAILVGALLGLHAAHEAKDERGAPLQVIHRDVSPQNVIVGVDGVARVLDFGIAKAAGRSQITREGQVKGKLGYMAPEQLQKSAERASDIYAAGVCLWEALTLQRLFSGDNESVILAKILAGIAPPPSKHVLDLSPDVDAVVLRALRRDPAQRFATAREMALALAAAIPPAPPAEVGAWVERLAAPSLARCAARLAAIEAEGATASPRSERSPRSEALPTAPVTTDPARSIALAAPPPKRMWIAWSALGAVIAAGALLASFAWGARVGAPRLAESASTSLAIAPPAPVEAPEAPASAAPIPSAAAPAPAPLPAASSPAPPPSVTRPPARPPAAAKGAPRPSCDPPYSVDSSGIRHYKKGCLR